MLNVPTLWTAFIFNFLALGLIWAYILRSYPSFEAARFWTASAFAAVAGGLLAIAATIMGSLVPLAFGGTCAVFASCLLAMGVRRFYGEPVRWRLTGAIAAATFAGSVHGVVVHTTIDCPSASSSGNRTYSDGSDRSW